MVKTTEDSNGKLISREMCEFNQFGDVRDCVDWDRGTTHRDMKDANGNWAKIGVRLIQLHPEPTGSA